VIAPAAGLKRAMLLKAERLLVAFLECSPFHVGALALLQDMRATQGRAAASEAFLSRIVRGSRVPNRAKVHFDNAGA
jgi:hypothetical protein